MLTGIQSYADQRIPRLPEPACLVQQRALLRSPLGSGHELRLGFVGVHLYYTSTNTPNQSS